MRIAIRLAFTMASLDLARGLSARMSQVNSRRSRIFRARRAGTRERSRTALFGGVAVLAVLLGWSPLARADGGQGGKGSDTGETGGAGGVTGGGVAGQPGRTGGRSSGSGGGGGGGGGAGASGGIGGRGSINGVIPGTGGAAGAAGTGAAGASGGAAGNATGGGGGGGGGGGASGNGAGAGAAALNNGAGTVLQGGTGGRGGNGSAINRTGQPDGGGGGGGGEGGQGALVTGATSNANAGLLRGGTGGNGGNTGAAHHYGPPRGGAGGSGGIGIQFLGSGATFTNGSTGVIQGGIGGNGGAGAAGFNTRGGAGGTGGIGLDGVGVTVTNHGAVTGGVGGVGGTSFGSQPAGTGGAGGGGVILANGSINNTAAGTITGGTGVGSGVGGVGISGTGNAHIITEGAISGGLSGGGARQNALVFTNGGNTLELRAGFAITGNAVGGASDAFVLGGVTSASMDASQIGASAQYRGFGIYRKTGASVWTLTDTTAATTPWQIMEGVLSVSQEGNLGATTGALTINGGVLQVTGASFASTARLINWGSAGGGFDIADAANTFTVGQNLTGGGPLQKFGVGRLVFTGTNTYSGGTTISAGILQLGNGGTSGSIVGDVVNNGTLVFERSDAVTFPGQISGTGAITQQGTGTTVLTGANSYSGATDVVRGTLVVNGNQSLATGLTTVRGGATLAGTGTLGGPVTVESAATLSPGQSPGTLTMGPLTLNGGAVLNMELGARGVAGGALNDLVVVNGNLTLDGTVNVTSTPGTSFDPGLYRLIIYSGTLNDNTLDIGTLPSSAIPGLVSVQTSVPNQVNLINASGTALRFWDGPANHDNGAFDGTSGVWRANGDRNWTDADPAVNGNWADNAFAVFLGRPGTVTVDDGAGQVNLAGAQFAVDGYTVAGPGALHATMPQTVIRVGDGTTAGRNMTATINAPIAGTGGIVKSDLGTLVLGGDNTFTGGTTIGAGTLQISRDANLGDAAGALALDGGTLRVSQDLRTARAIDVLAGGGAIDTAAHTVTATGPLSGIGDWAKLGTGTLVLAGANGSSGTATVAAGTLRAGAAGAFGPAAGYVVGTGATLDLAGFDQTVAGLTNAGTVSLSGGGTTALTVRGNYIGQNGVLRMAGGLAGSDSAVDRLVIDGGTASGSTTVQLANLGGLGALTTGNGIELIGAINGATTTAQTTKDAFTLAGGHVDAGAYEYHLHAADANGAGENWYLRSTVLAAAPAGPGIPATPGLELPAYRAEVPLFAAVPGALRQGSLSMLSNMHQRMGDQDTISTGTARRVWGRLLSTDLDIRQGGTVSPASEGRVSGFQAGTDLLARDHWRAGLYVGQLDGDIAVRGFASGIYDRPVGSYDLRSEYLGLYGTWISGTGFYADAVLQAGRHRYSVNPLVGFTTKGKSDSLMASIEVGQSFGLGGGWHIEPQLQLVHQQMDMDDASLRGAWVRQDSHSGWIARAGVRLKGEFATGSGTLQPYGRLNVYRSGSGTDVSRFVGPAGSTDIMTPARFTFTELATGLTLKLGARTSVYGEIGKLWSSGGDARVEGGVQGSVGVRVHW